MEEPSDTPTTVAVDFDEEKQQLHREAIEGVRDALSEMKKIFREKQHRKMSRAEKEESLKELYEFSESMSVENCPSDFAKSIERYRELSLAYILVALDDVESPIAGQRAHHAFETGEIQVVDRAQVRRDSWNEISKDFMEIQRAMAAAAKIATRYGVDLDTVRRTHFKDLNDRESMPGNAAADASPEE